MESAVMRLEEALSYKERSLTCPKCGYEFDILYARAVSCQACRRLIGELYCDMARCPQCDHEFPTTQRVVNAVRKLQNYRPHDHMGYPL